MRHDVMRRAVALLALVPALSGAQSLLNADRAVALTVENDALGGTSDSSYTNGIRARWTFMVWNPRLNKLVNVLALRGALDRIFGELPRDNECVPFGARSSRPCGFITFSVGQTMYTPSTILDTLPRPDERPYAGLMFASLGMHKPGRRIDASTELLLGVIGPWSGAEATQSIAHWTWSTQAAKPRGWRNQLRNQPQAAIINSWAIRPPFPGELCLKGCDGDYKDGRFFDLTGTAELALGTHMRRGSAGYVVRLGLGFPELLGVDRIATTGIDPSVVLNGLWNFIEKYQPWFFVFVSNDGRHVWHNAFLEGTVADVGGAGWRDISVIAPRSRVGEKARGVSAGIGPITATYQKVDRSTEYTADGGRHRYGSLTIMLTTRKN